MKNLSNYTLGDEYVAPANRLSKMLIQQGSKGGPSLSWQETMGRLSQQLAGMYMQHKDGQQRDAAYGTFGKQVPNEPTFSPEEVQGFASKLTGGVSDSLEPNKSDMAQASLDSHVAPVLPQTARPDQVAEEQFYPPQSESPSKQIDGSGWDRAMPDFSQAHQLNSQAGVPNADPRQQAVDLMQGNQTEMSQQDYIRQQLQGLENNPYAKRLLAQMTMQGMDRDYQAGLSQTARQQKLDDIKAGQEFKTNERIAGQTFSKDETDRKLKSAENVAGGKDTFGNEDKLRDEFNAGAKDFEKVRDAYGRILASAKNPSAAGDLALIFNYMKVLDPGSTVREGEFATAQNSASIPDRLRAKYNQVIQGERLAPVQRKDFVDRAGGLYEQQEAFYKEHEKRYQGLAQQYNLDPSRVTYGLNQGLPETPNLPEGFVED